MFLKKGQQNMHNDINVGDIVKVVTGGSYYTAHDEWLIAQNISYKYRMQYLQRQLPSQEELSNSFTVLSKGEKIWGFQNDEMLYLVLSCKDRCYLVDKPTLRKVSTISNWFD